LGLLAEGNLLPHHELDLLGAQSRWPGLLSRLLELVPKRGQFLLQGGHLLAQPEVLLLIFSRQTGQDHVATG
jgi:hypothetical protein